MRSISDGQVFRESLLAAAPGPFFPNRKFHALFALERVEVEAIAESLTSTTPLSEDVALALNNAMINLLGYLHDQSCVALVVIGHTGLQVIFSRWQASRAEV